MNKPLAVVVAIIGLCALISLLYTRHKSILSALRQQHCKSCGKLKSGRLFSVFIIIEFAIFPIGQLCKLGH